MKSKQKRILAICSGGGHWIQMMRLKPAFAGHEVIYATVDSQFRKEVFPARFHSIPDANRSNKVGLIWLALRTLLVVMTVRPHVVVTTGAAPGYFAIRFARMLGAKTLFLDSIANAEVLSLSAQLSMKHADKLLTQWPDLAQQQNTIEYEGRVL